MDIYLDMFENYLICFIEFQVTIWTLLIVASGENLNFGPGATD